MKCPKCQHQNRQEAIFCSECGTELQYVCPQCGANVEPTAKFCDQCGNPFTEQVVEHTSQVKLPSTEHKSPDAERRQLTVMFCDLVGSTQLSQELDPEELREVVRDYQSACSKVIARYEGHIAQYLGDGLLVYFGYPQAHEDDTQRAVRTGLGVVETLEQLGNNLQGGLGVNLAVRVGIHTGLVVVGEMGAGDRHEQLALGDTPNIASRLEGLAPTNGVVISADSYRLIEGFFHCRDLGPHSLKGLSQPMEVYQVLHESMARSRLEVSAISGLTPLVGREKEVGLLLELWEGALRGMGQVVLLSGEAGIGKSRLVQMLKDHLGKDPQTWLTESRCSPYYRNSAFYPIIDLLEREIFQFGREDTPEEKIEKLEKFLLGYGFSLEEMVPLFTSLLSLPLPPKHSPLNLSPEQSKQKTMEAFLTILLKRSGQQPVLFVMEDMHWIDPSTLELLSLLVDQEPKTSILILLTYRPDFSPTWIMHAHLTLLALNRLGQWQIGEMVDKMTGGKPLPHEVLDQIVNKTDGVPLFVEELTKMVLESGLLREEEDGYKLTGPLTPLAIPATLQDSLMARLDRLATVKDVAQLGATIGREFSYELIQAVSLLDEESLQRELSRLVGAELVYQRGLPPQATYLFKNTLIQEAAYQSLLKSMRQQYHQRIAHALERHFPDTVKTQPELLAYHYSEAGLIEQATPYWQRAGQRAAERSANVEAIGHLSKGLELIKTLPETPERNQQELDLQIALGVPLIFTKGNSAPEVERTYARARELCEQVDETPQLFQVLLGLRRFYFARGELQRALDLGEELLALAASVGDPSLLSRAHMMQAETLLWLGEFVLVQEHAEQGIALYDPQQVFLYGTDARVSCQLYSAIALWHLGYPDQALKNNHEALARAQELSHPINLAYALSLSGFAHMFSREVEAAQERAGAAIALSTEQGFTFFSAWGTFLRGWAMAEHGEVEEGITQIRQGLADYRAIGAEGGHSNFLSLLAEAYGKVGKAEEGLDVLSEALDLVEKTGERWWEAESYRLKGKLLLASCSKSRKEIETEAEECFHKAIEISAQQRAKSQELRAAMSLSRLWQEQDKKEEAQNLLAEIYGWFTEGFDTADLKEAKALLDELS